MTLDEAWKSGVPLLADGATGTMLQAVGLAAGEAPERWTLEKPDAIARLAQLYIGAGSDIVYTNTFGADRIRMNLCGLGDRIETLNLRATALVREAAATAGRTVHVAGSIGPTGEMMEPYGDLRPDTARAAFAEQAKALATAGVDLFVCETFSDLDELLLCLETVLEHAGGKPVFTSMAFGESGRTMMGVTPEQAVTRLSAAGATGVGGNCSVGPDSLATVIEAMKQAKADVPLLAKPNAGMPQLVNGQTTYLATPEDLADFAGRMMDLGVAIVGGCCGTTPDHLRAMRQRLDRR